MFQKERLSLRLAVCLATSGNIERKLHLFYKQIFGFLLHARHCDVTMTQVRLPSIYRVLSLEGPT